MFLTMFTPFGGYYMWIIYPHNKCDTLEITFQPFVPQDR
jgi:hypothetical protein